MSATSWASPSGGPVGCWATRGPRIGIGGGCQMTSRGWWPGSSRWRRGMGGMGIGGTGQDLAAAIRTGSGFGDVGLSSQCRPSGHHTASVRHAPVSGRQYADAPNRCVRTSDREMGCSPSLHAAGSSRARSGPLLSLKQAPGANYTHTARSRPMATVATVEPGAWRAGDRRSVQGRGLLWEADQEADSVLQASTKSPGVCRRPSALNMPRSSVNSLTRWRSVICNWREGSRKLSRRSFGGAVGPGYVRKRVSVVGDLSIARRTTVGVHEASSGCVRLRRHRLTSQALVADSGSHRSADSGRLVAWW